MRRVIFPVLLATVDGGAIEVASRISGLSLFTGAKLVNILVVKNASGRLEKLLSEASNALRQVGREVFVLASYGNQEVRMIIHCTRWKASC